MIVIPERSSKMFSPSLSSGDKIIYGQREDTLFCSSIHGSGMTLSAKPEINSQCHFKFGWSPSVVTFLMQIPSNIASSMPSKTGAFVEFTLRMSLMSIPFTVGRALWSQPSSGWSLEPLLNLMGTFTRSMTMFLMLIFDMYPPRPASVLIRTPAAESQTWRSSIVTFEIPPDISLPIPTAEQVGVVPNILLIVIFELGRAIDIP